MEIRKRQGANLPHWTTTTATYFVTFRLADALPHPLITAYKQERAHLLAALQDHQQGNAAATFTPGDLNRLHQLFSEKIEHHLDAGTGACWMTNPQIADLIQAALLHFHPARYYLHTWSVMPNHVHAVLRPEPLHDLPAILQSWKSFTAKAANRILARTGTFWQTEYYDHLTRNAADLKHCIDYTLANPTKARLKSWRWVGSSSNMGETPMPQ